MARTKKDAAKARKTWKTALYIRLSREDGDKEESDSIVTQRNMLTDYISHYPEFELYDIYIDDGYTGTNFKRPDFQRMIDDMKAGNINCIIVKDLSRFGRDYIGVGEYQEKIFPEYDVRFIALSEHIDTHLRQGDNESIIIPFTNIINEQYARDISRKVRSALDTKRRKGEFIGAFACYGYKKDPENKNHLIVDEEAADNVRNIFKWFIGGMSKQSIALRLNEMGIPCPSEYKRLKGLKYVNSRRLKSTTYWTHTSVHRILSSEVYIGNMVQHTQATKSFKVKKNVQLDKSEWIVVKNTHEPIIDMETWNTAQRLLNESTRKSPFTGEIHLFAGLIKCADCGRAMKKRISHSGKYEYYVCGTYMAYGKARCLSHSIRKDELTEIVLNEINSQIEKYMDFEKLRDDIVRLEKIKAQTAAKNRLLNDLSAKFEKIKGLRLGLYEDYKSGFITREEYFDFKKRYDDDIEKLSAQIGNITKAIENINSVDELKQSEELILKYEHIETLTRDIVVSLIKSIIVHADKTITINFTFIPM